MGNVSDRVSIGIVETDTSWLILAANPAARSILGLAKLDACLASDVRGCFEPLDRLWSRDPTITRVTHRDVRIIGRPSVRVDVSIDSAAEPWILTIVDVSHRLAAEQEAESLRAKIADNERSLQRLNSIREELTIADAATGSDAAAVPVMIGRSEAMRRIRSQISRVAPTDTTVLINGETGSGKELVARMLHAESPRAREPFIAVNCAALPESLIESELFGHERGAFTGAERRRLGKFELADDGTIFLDEVAEMPLPAQAKLLRVLQESTLERIGGSETVKVNVRILAATHRDLVRRVERSLFREDLYYRLNVFRIEVPALRDRREDLRELIEHLHARVARRMARPVLPVSERSWRRIMAYRWPGNIRELANAVERATLLADGPELEIELPDSPLRAAGSTSDASIAESSASAQGTPRDVLLDLSLEQLQRLHIMHALESCSYRVFGERGAARKLAINPNTLLARMDKFGIPRPRIARRGSS